MTYDKLTVTLLTLLSREEHDSTNAQIARHLLTHGEVLGDLSVKELAAACHVGTGTVSRFAREAGFDDFTQLKEAFSSFSRSFAQVAGESEAQRRTSLASHASGAIEQVQGGMDREALVRLVADLDRFERVSAFGLLKGQAAALDLQVDLLMQGKWVDTCTSLAEQADRIAAARRDQLVVLFSYSGAYFEYIDLSQGLRRLDRPTIWMVCGRNVPRQEYVSDVLRFDSDLDPLGHPYQLEYVAGLIAQEYAALAASRQKTR